MWVTKGSDGCVVFAIQKGEAEELSSKLLYEVILKEVRCSKGFARHLTKVLLKKGHIEVRPWIKRKQRKS
tara:strand:- start:186 stop:395 length:210 start_codon:yes stop_codon:yes gene_type:complete